MYSELKGRTAIVTGGSSGIGKSIVERFHEEGMNVVFTYHSGDEDANKIVDDLDSGEASVVTMKCDVTKEQEIIDLVKQTIDQFGGFDVMVNNAGIQNDVRSHELSVDEFDKVINTNLRGTFIGTREAVKHYLDTDKKGSVINISSVHEIIPWPHYAHYTASKGGLKLLTQSMALEYSRLGIRINNIAPGSINTPINEDFFSTPEEKEGADDFVPMGYVGEPEHISNIAAFMASEQSVYITGQTIVADGGLSLYPSHRDPEYDE
ncbi:glucose 1-dehydrogenase [Salinicoccus sp. ID82-1]|uniref:glucose 1-dehydrogenase n=1 Tax=Salinicoccus sp. ID82-1 TaxID=2820269 RepID=UPI001F016619|nr:glucose 1-dehydrogenase [Salinicoccus sp. ID82-1]MCG1010865.1 glucose 1-dehydrogenase [Salinicoccus sp. ID82-1]